MNPQMMEQAQNMMRNMSPEQMANMRQMVSQMSPDQMEHMQRMVSNMGIGGAASQSNQAAYHLSGARVLKEDGNALHKAGNHAGALVKYENALENLAEQSSEEALSLRTSCELNKAICHLKLEHWLDCEKICSQVLMRGPNLKALYRRGQARLGLKDYKFSVQDLQQASQLCPLDDTAQQALIEAKLAEANKGLEDYPDASEPSPLSYNDGSVTIEEVVSDTHVPGKSTMASAPQGINSDSTLGNRSGEASRARLDAMCNMPEDHLRHSAKAAGMPEMDGKMAKQMAEMMRGMDPKQLNDMMAMSEQLHSSGAGSSHAFGAAGAASMDPAIAVDMMRNMSPEQIELMAKAAADSGMMPPGAAISPELLKQSAELMKSMTPQELQRMQDMASSTNQTSSLPVPVQTGAGEKAAIDVGGMADMLKDPKAMKQAISMMKQMDEGQLANLMKMNKPNMTDEDARRMAQQMKGADDRVVGVLLGGISVLAQARAKVVCVSEWLLKNPVALVSVVLLVVAVALRFMGIM